MITPYLLVTKLRTEKSVSYDTCLLNTDTKYEVRPFYLSRTEVTQNWNHYEKVKDFFLIFNKKKRYNNKS